MNSPTFSIIIPTYGRPGSLARCLAALSRLQYERDRFEVIVVDDGSPMPLDETVAPFRSQMDLTLIRQANAGPAAARNTGAGKAKHHYLVFTDDDCAPSRQWLTHYAAQFEQTPDAMVGGSVLNVLPDDVFATASQALVSYLYEYYNRDPQRAVFFTSNNFALTRQGFFESGGFDSSYCRAAAEDREFCERWNNTGHRMVYVPAAMIEHSHYLSLRKFWRQHFNYGRGAFRFHQLRATRGQKPIRVEPPAFYRLLLSYPFRIGMNRAMEIAILLWISQAANVLGFFWEQCASAEQGTRQGVSESPAGPALCGAAKMEAPKA